MKKICCMLMGKIYEVKRQYPIIRKLGERMHTIKKELNKGRIKDT